MLNKQLKLFSQHRVTLSPALPRLSHMFSAMSGWSWDMYGVSVAAC
jgi:hypothetical protein